jgi:hypothetical protein
MSASPSPGKSWIKTKITACAVIFAGKAGVGLSRLDHRANALGAQRLLQFAALLKNSHRLQVGQELAIGGPQGEGAIVTESGRLTAVSAFSHSRSSFLAVLLPAVRHTPRSNYSNLQVTKNGITQEARIIPLPLFTGAKFYHKTYPSTSKVL